MWWWEDEDISSEGFDILSINKTRNKKQGQQLNSGKGSKVLKI